MDGGWRPLREEDIEEYVAFRQRLEEFIHLFAAWQFYREKKRDDPEWPINLTIHVALMVWLYSFFDPNGLDVRTLWRRAFPWLKTRLEAWRRRFDPELELLEEFRHVTGAHFSRKIEEHNRVRKALSGDGNPKGGAARRAMELFLEMATEVMDHEKERPELAAAVASYGLKPGT